MSSKIGVDSRSDSATVVTQQTRSDKSFMTLLQAIPSLLNLCRAVKKRLVRQVSTFELQKGELLNLSDGIRFGMIYVVQGSLSITIESIRKDHARASFLLDANQYIDHYQLGKRYKSSKILSSRALSTPTIVKVLPNWLFENCVGDGAASGFSRTYENMSTLLSTLIPPFGYRSLTKRMEVLDSFSEQLLDPGTVLETEGSRPQNLYVLISGVVNILKRPPALYGPNRETAIETIVQKFHGPREANTDPLGVVMGSLEEPNLLCEDAIFFKQPLLYSVQCKSKCLVWKLPIERAMTSFPLETQREIMLICMEKYRWFFVRAQKIDQQLDTSDTRERLHNAVLTEERKKINYPRAIPHLQENIKNYYRNKLQICERSYHMSQNLRIYRNARKLTGYVEAKDERRMESINKLFKPVRHGQDAHGPLDLKQAVLTRVLETHNQQIAESQYDQTIPTFQSENIFTIKVSPARELDITEQGDHKVTQNRMNVTTPDPGSRQASNLCSVTPINMMTVNARPNTVAQQASAKMPLAGRPKTSSKYFQHARMQIQRDNLNSSGATLRTGTTRAMSSRKRGSLGLASTFFQQKNSIVKAAPGEHLLLHNLGHSNTSDVLQGIDNSTLNLLKIREVSAAQLQPTVGLNAQLQYLNESSTHEKCTQKPKRAQSSWQRPQRKASSSTYLKQAQLFRCKY